MKYIKKGHIYAITSAFLFGIIIPFIKILSDGLDPWLLAGLLYSGSGISLFLLSLLKEIFRGRDKTKTTFKISASSSDLFWLAGSIVFGGILAAAFLINGLTKVDVSSASLLLNFEVVLTALLAWFIFKETFNSRTALGISFIVAGGLLLSWKGSFHLSSGESFIVLACLCWAIDNNFMKKITTFTPLQIATIKSLVAGTINLIIAFSLGSSLPSFSDLIFAMILGFLGYGGLSLLFLVLALRHLGTARAMAYFSTSSFIGAVASVIFLGEKVTLFLILASVLMAIGIWIDLGREKT